MKKYIINKFVVGALLLTVTSCTDKYFLSSSYKCNFLVQD